MPLLCHSGLGLAPEIVQLLLLGESVHLIGKFESTYARIAYLLMYQWTPRNDDYDTPPRFWDMNGHNWFWESEHAMAAYLQHPVVDTPTDG